jgi:hypothetical protein
MLQAQNTKLFKFNLIFCVQFFLLIPSLFLLTNPFKLIWFDEFLQFAYGSLGNLNEFISVAVNSARDINHNQTGVYSLLNFIMLQNFNVNIFSLRGPSFLAGALIVLLLYYYLKRTNQFSINLNIIYLMFMLSFYSIFQFMAEGRPYIILSATCLGIFVYLYSLHVHQISFKKIFMASVIFGSLFHPYFFPYLVLLSFIFLIFFRSQRQSKRELVFLLGNNIISGIICIFLYVNVWGDNLVDFSDFDPFLYTGGFLYYVPMLFAGNFSPITIGQLTSGSVAFLISSLSVFFYVAFLTLLVILVFKNKFNSIIRLNIYLILVTFLFSIFLSIISLYFNYWVLTRQWIGSLIIIVFCLVNIMIELFKDRNSLILKKMTVLCIVFLFVFQNMYYIHMNLSNYNIKSQIDKSLILKDHLSPTNIDDFIELSNVNLSLGGSIYPQFRNFYLPYIEKENSSE